MSLEEVTKILGYAYSAGVDTFDASITYKNSKTVLGQVGLQPWRGRAVSKIPAIIKENKHGYAMIKFSGNS